MSFRRKLEINQKETFTNYLPIKKLENAYTKYLKLTKDIKYSFYYRLYNELLAASRKYSSNYENLKELNSLGDSLLSYMLDTWKLQTLINPKLKITLKNLSKEELTKNSPEARLLHSLGLIPKTIVILDSKLPRIKPVFLFSIHISGKPKKITVKKDTLFYEKEYAKFICYMMHTNIKTPLRQLGRTYNRDKDTIKAWVEEVENWSPSKKELLTNEFMFGKRKKDADILDLSSSFRLPYDDSVNPNKINNDYSSDCYS